MHQNMTSIYRKLQSEHSSGRRNVCENSEIRRMPDTIHAMFINLMHNQCYTCYNVQVKWLRYLIQECLYNMHYNTFASRPLLCRCLHIKAGG